MHIGKFAMELAEKRVEDEVEAMVARTQARLGPPSQVTECACGEEIPEARRKAMPSAVDCIDCATARERRGRR